MDEDDLKRLLETNSSETRRHFEDVSVETRRNFDAAVGRVEASAVQTRRHFDVTAERLENKFQLIAETVAELDAKYDRRIDGLEERMDRGFAETQAMSGFLMRSSTAASARWKTV